MKIITVCVLSLLLLMPLSGCGESSLDSTIDETSDPSVQEEPTLFPPSEKESPDLITAPSPDEPSSEPSAYPPPPLIITNPSKLQYSTEMRMYVEEEENDIYIEYPYITTLPDGSVDEEDINSLILSEVLAYKDSLFPDPGKINNYNWESKCVITFESNDILSMLFESNIYSYDKNARHNKDNPERLSHTITIDIKKRRILQYSEVVAESEWFFKKRVEHAAGFRYNFSGPDMIEKYPDTLKGGAWWGSGFCFTPNSIIITLSTSQSSAGYFLVEFPGKFLNNVWIFDDELDPASLKLAG